MNLVEAKSLGRDFENEINMINDQIAELEDEVELLRITARMSRGELEGAGITPYEQAKAKERLSAITNTLERLEDQREDLLMDPTVFAARSLGKSELHENLSQKYMAGEITLKLPPIGGLMQGKSINPVLEVRRDSYVSQLADSETKKALQATALQFLKEAKDKGYHITISPMFAGAASRIKKGEIADFVIEAIQEAPRKFVDIASFRTLVNPEGPADQLTNQDIEILATVTDKAILKKLLYDAKVLLPAAKIDGVWHSFLDFNILNFKKAQDELEAAGYGRPLIFRPMLNENYKADLARILAENDNYGLLPEELDMTYYQPLGYGIIGTPEDVAEERSSFSSEADYETAVEFSKKYAGRVMYSQSIPEGHGWYFPAQLMTVETANEPDDKPAALNVKDKKIAFDWMHNLDNMGTVDSNWLAFLGAMIEGDLQVLLEASSKTDAEKGKGGGFTRYTYRVGDEERVGIRQVENDVLKAAAKERHIDFASYESEAAAPGNNNGSMFLRTYDPETGAYGVLENNLGDRLQEALAIADPEAQREALFGLRQQLVENMGIVPVLKVAQVTPKELADFLGITEEEAEAKQKAGELPKEFLRVIFEIRAWDIQNAVINDVLSGEEGKLNTPDRVQAAGTNNFTDFTLDSPQEDLFRVRFAPLKTMDNYDNELLQGVRTEVVRATVDPSVKLLGDIPNTNELTAVGASLGEGERAATTVPAEDIAEMVELRQQGLAGFHKNVDPTPVKPAPATAVVDWANAFTEEERQRLIEKQRRMYQDGEITMIVMAGGEATRFGGPKTFVEVSPELGDFLEIKAANLRWVRETFWSEVPLYILSSEKRLLEFKDQLAQRGYYGFTEDDFKWYVQGTIDTFIPTDEEIEANFKGKAEEIERHKKIAALLRSENPDGVYRFQGAERKVPPGHFDAIASFIISGRLSDALGRGIKYAPVVNIDGLQAILKDDGAIAHFAEQETDFGFVLAEKNLTYSIADQETGVPILDKLIVRFRDNALSLDGLTEFEGELEHEGKRFVINQETKTVDVFDIATGSRIPVTYEIKPETGGTLVETADGEITMREGFELTKDFPHAEAPFFNTNTIILNLESLLKFLGVTQEELAAMDFDQRSKLVREQMVKRIKANFEFKKHTVIGEYPEYGKVVQDKETGEMKTEIPVSQLTRIMLQSAHLPGADVTYYFFPRADVFAPVKQPEDKRIAAQNNRESLKEVTIYKREVSGQSLGRPERIVWVFHESFSNEFDDFKAVLNEAYQEEGGIDAGIVMSVVSAAIQLRPDSRVKITPDIVFVPLTVGPRRFNELEKVLEERGLKVPVFAINPKDTYTVEAVRNAVDDARLEAAAKALGEPDQNIAEAIARLESDRAILAGEIKNLRNDIFRIEQAGGDPANINSIKQVISDLEDSVIEIDKLLEQLKTQIEDQSLTIEDITPEALAKLLTDSVDYFETFQAARIYLLRIYGDFEKLEEIEDLPVETRDEARDKYFDDLMLKAAEAQIAAVGQSLGKDEMTPESVARILRESAQSSAAIAAARKHLHKTYGDPKELEQIEALPFQLRDQARDKYYQDLWLKAAEEYIANKTAGKSLGEESEAIQKLKEKGFFDFKISPNGKLFLARGPGRIVKLFETATGTQLQLPSRESSIEIAGFSRDGKYLHIEYIDETHETIDVTTLRVAARSLGEEVRRDQVLATLRGEEFTRYVAMTEVEKIDYLKSLNPNITAIRSVQPVVPEQITVQIRGDAVFEVPFVMPEALTVGEESLVLAIEAMAGSFIALNIQDNNPALFNKLFAALFDDRDQAVKDIVARAEKNPEGPIAALNVRVGEAVPSVVFNTSKSGSEMAVLTQLLNNKKEVAVVFEEAGGFTKKDFESYLAAFPQDVVDKKTRQNILNRTVFVAVDESQIPEMINRMVSLDEPVRIVGKRAKQSLRSVLKNLNINTANISEHMSVVAPSSVLDGVEAINPGSALTFMSTDQIATPIQDEKAYKFMNYAWGSTLAYYGGRDSSEFPEELRRYLQYNEKGRLVLSDYALVQFLNQLTAEFEGLQQTLKAA